MSRQKIEFTTRLTREDVAGIVEALIEGLKEGNLKVHKSGKTLEMPVPRVVDLEIEAKMSTEKAKFSIEVSWRTNRAENPDLPENDETVALEEDDIEYVEVETVTTTEVVTTDAGKAERAKKVQSKSAKK